MEQKFSDGSAGAFTELPVSAAYLSWTRGNAQLRQIADKDPGAYLGGWRAFLVGKDEIVLPSLPLPVVERTSEDGKHLYKVYAHNFVNFLPIQHRTRFELREKAKDETTGREYEKIVSVSKDRRQGYAPYRQVFGLLYSLDLKTRAPAVLKVWKWSAFITFEKAGQAWNKITIPTGKALIRRYGSVGTKEKDMIVPNFEVYGQGRSTPIEAIDLKHPVFVDIDDEMNTLWDSSQEWKNCPRWNAEGKVQEEESKSAVMLEFEARCNEIRLTNIEIEQLLKENGGDYTKALAALVGDSMTTEVDPNQAFADAEEGQQ